VTEAQDRSAQLDFSQPHIARVYDFLLGGRDNYAADRAVAKKIIESLPAVQVGVRAQRAVLRRVVRFLVGEAGVTQLIDIGSGLPTAENVHQIAHRLHADTRVVYVDNDPVVLAHARALLAEDAETVVVDGDLRDPEGIMHDPQVRAHLDWHQPIGLLLCGILHHMLDSERPAELTATLIDVLPAGSFVFIHHLVDSGDPAVAGVQAAMQSGMDRGKFRTYEEILPMFAGLELVAPGLVPVPRWRPDRDATPADDNPVMRLACVGVARKP
jgi:hypothetical protein